MNRFLLGTAAALFGATASTSALACLVEPPPEDPPWTLWQVTKSDSPLGPDYVRQNLYMNIGIFSSAGNPMNCACGIGITGVGDWTALGLLQVASDSAFKVVKWEGDCLTGAPGDEVMLQGMGGSFGSKMGFSAPASSSLSGWYGDSSVSWFGFTGGPIEVAGDPDTRYAVCFSFDVHVSIDDMFKDGRKGILAAGVADDNLLPDYDDPFHPVLEISSAAIPAPAALALMALAGLSSGRRRRR